MNDVGKKIKKLREFRGITQKKLGDFLGFSEAQISYIESGSRKISNEDLNKIAEILNFSINDFILSNNHFRATKVSEGDEIISKEMWDDFIDFAKKQ